MTPLLRYDAEIATGKFKFDSNQQEIVKQLNIIYEAWFKQHVTKKSSLLMQWCNKSKKLVKGMYLWGGVGAGKTWLMDLFYNCVPENMKLRFHFHRFMQQIHEQLKQYQGKVNPLQFIAKQYAQKAKLIFLDEFIVSDITDAMLLANFLAALFDEGVTLIATSNVPPDDLYKNGLQRGRFLPAIDLLKTHLHVFYANVMMDYRLRTLAQAGVYFSPLGILAEQQLMKHYINLTHTSHCNEQIITINGRTIKTISCTTEVVWLDFKELCHSPRSQRDYLEIARLYNTVIVSNVPYIKSNQDNVIIYFIHLIDVFYDTKVKLILSAETTIDKLYTQGRYQFEYQRTQSRLLEMQSHEYLNSMHLG
ncbi:MAG: Cell division protein ZapE [Legionellaceae bacterium]